MRAARPAARRRSSPSTSTASAPTTTRIAAACARYGVPLIEDAAEALGATYQGRPAGTLRRDRRASRSTATRSSPPAAAACWSRTRKDWIEQARFLATQARDPAPHYEHSEIGYNYRMSNLLAAVGRGQLRVLDERVERRAGELRVLPAGAGRPARASPSCRRRRTAARTRWLTCITVDPARVRRDARGHPAARWSARTSSRGRSGSRCTCSRSSPRAGSRGGAVAAELFERGLCLPERLEPDRHGSRADRVTDPGGRSQVKRLPERAVRRSDRPRQPLPVELLQRRVHRHRPRPEQLRRP